MFEKVAPKLQSQALLEWRLRQAELHDQAFRAALEALPRPAYLLDAAARVVATNSVGKQQLETHGQKKQRQLCEWIREAHAENGEQSAYRLAGASLTVLRTRGISRHYLLIEEASSQTVERAIAATALKWSLTKRQIQILRQMADGETNKDIAATLACSLRSVEHHVSILLKKSGVGSRVGLLASLFYER